MGKTLLNKIGNTIRRSALAGLIALSFAGCEPVINPTPITPVVPVTPPVTNSAPTIKSTPDLLSVNEKSSYSYQVNATDKEGDELTYSLIKAPEGWSIDSSTGLMEGMVPSTTEDTIYPVEIDISDGKNTTKQNFNLTVKNLLDITGNIQDNENHTTQPGEVKIYDSSNPLNPTQLGSTISTQTDGTFEFHADSPISQITLKAKTGNSYVRTITLDGTKDYDLTDRNLNGKIRVVPYPTFGETPEQFRDFIMRINYTYGGMSRWDLPNGGLKGIEILSVNPEGSSSGSFDSTQLTAIESRIKNLDDIGAYVKGRDLSTLPIEINSSQKHSSSEGWIIVVPSKSIPDDFKVGVYLDGKTELSYLNGTLSSGIINGGIIKILPEHAKTNDSVLTYDPVLTHEFGHALIAPDGEANYGYNPDGSPKIIDGKSSPLLDTQTIMNPSWNIYEPNFSKPKVADVKAGKIVYEETYLPRERLDDILGTSW